MAEELLVEVRKFITAIESTYNTDAIDLANNLAVARRYMALMQESGLTPQMDHKERNLTRPSFGYTRGINIRRNVDVMLAGEVIAANNPGNAGGEYPYDLDEAMRMAGLARTVSSGVSATYAPDTDEGESGTIYEFIRFQDEYKWQLCYATGVKCDFEMDLPVGEIATWRAPGMSANYPYDTSVPANFEGWSDDLAWFDADGTILLDRDGNSITYTGTETVHDPTPMYVEAATFTLDSVAFPVSSGKIKHDNGVVAKRVTSANPVVSKVQRSHRKVNVDLVLEHTGAAFKKTKTKMLTGAEIAGTIVLTDRTGSGGSTLTITIPKLQVRPVTKGERDRFRNWTIPLTANGDWSSAQVGDNEISYVWSVTP